MMASVISVITRYGDVIVAMSRRASFTSLDLPLPSIPGGVEKKKILDGIGE